MLEGRTLSQVREVVRREFEVAEVAQDLVEAAEDRVLAPERILPKEQFKHGAVEVTVRLPEGVGHGDLVQVGEERSDKGVGRRFEARDDGGGYFQ